MPPHQFRLLRKDLIIRSSFREIMNRMLLFGFKIMGGKKTTVDGGIRLEEISGVQMAGGGFLTRVFRD